VTKRPTVLVIEDDEGIRELVTFHLERAGFVVLEAVDAEAAWPLVERADAVVLDWMLPGGSGLDLLVCWRSGHRDIRKPVLMLTARASEVDRVAGLDAGADDYLVKPFSAAELVARVRALLRRVEPIRRLELGVLVVDVDRARVEMDGAEVALTRREFELLAYLAAHPGRVFSRADLLDRVWGEDFVGTERTVDQHVAQLRSRLDGLGLETVRGRGYRLVGAGKRS
jgi:DNA-binding response OmpR family regulator